MRQYLEALEVNISVFTWSYLILSGQFAVTHLCLKRVILVHAKNILSNCQPCGQVSCLLLDVSLLLLYWLSFSWQPYTYHVECITLGSKEDLGLKLSRTRRNLSNVFIDAIMTKIPSYGTMNAAFVWRVTTKMIKLQLCPAMSSTISTIDASETGLNTKQLVHSARLRLPKN